MGWVWNTEVRRLSEPTVTSEPSDFTARPLTPPTGAVTVVQERFSSACFSAAWVMAKVEVASSYSFWLMACWATSVLRRAISRLA